MEAINPSLILLTGGIIIFVVIFLVGFIKKYLKDKNKKNLILMGVTITTVALMIIFEAYMVNYYITESNHHYLEYCVEMSSTSEENVNIYLPVSADRDIQNSIGITSGTGEIEIIESEHGVCLEINFIGNIAIQGTFDKNNGIGSHDLTMMNGIRPNLDPNVVIWEWVEYWIYYKSSNSLNNNCSLKLLLIHETYDWWESHKFNGYLDDGWNTYLAEHEALS